LSFLPQTHLLKFSVAPRRVRLRHALCRKVSEM
jgi:hypothetical protein